MPGAYETRATEAFYCVAPVEPVGTHVTAMSTLAVSIRAWWRRATCTRPTQRIALVPYGFRVERTEIRLVRRRVRQCAGRRADSKVTGRCSSRSSRGQGRR